VHFVQDVCQVGVPAEHIFVAALVGNGTDEAHDEVDWIVVNMDIWHIAGIGVVVGLAALIQSAVGFAFALFSTPLLLWLGVPLPNAITVVSVCCFIQSVVGARHLQAAVPWRAVGITTAVRLVTFVFGLLILKRLDGLSIDHVRLVVGCILCILVTMQYLAKVRPSEKVHWGWSSLAFGSSGLLSGICGMSGPPLVLWAFAHDWSAKKIRGYLFAAFAATIPVQIVLLYVTFGAGILHSLRVSLLVAPAVLLGVAVGLPIGNRMPRALLRKIVLLILLFVGLRSILRPILALVW